MRGFLFFPLKFGRIFSSLPSSYFSRWTSHRRCLCAIPNLDLLSRFWPGFVCMGPACRGGKSAPHPIPAGCPCVPVSWFALWRNGDDCPQLSLAELLRRQNTETVGKLSNTADLRWNDNARVGLCLADSTGEPWSHKEHHEPQRTRDVLHFIREPT